MAARYADDLVVGTVRDTHAAVASRVLGSPARRPVSLAWATKALHDGISRSVYGSLSLALRATGAGLVQVGGQGVGPRLDDSNAGRALRSAVNGLIGDRLRDEGSPLALDMSVRVGSAAVRLDAAHLRAAFPQASGRVVVFVHGLGEHEGHWEHKSGELGGSYGSRLQAASGWTPVYLRLNTGLPVGENGVELSQLIQQLVAAWPAPVHRLALVGHSMGGLVIRAACALDTGASRPWTAGVSDVITLGTPHLGADLAAGVSHGARLLALAPEVAGFGRILDHRSPGIRDLERGLPDLPPLPHVRYRLVSAAVGSPRSLVGRLLGDLLVRRGSATATRRALRIFPDAEVLHVPNADHFALLNHPDVCRAMRQWLA